VSAFRTLDKSADTAERVREQIVGLLGGSAVIKGRFNTEIAVHEMLVKGMPGRAVRHLVERLNTLKDPSSVEKAIGMSVRTYQRFKQAPSKKLNLEQSGRAWQFAEILAKASRLMGGQPAAERWLESEVMALDGKRPIDLLTTPAGVKLVEEFLVRVEYGVFM